MPPIRISPSSGCSKPAINRSEVVLPQPDGPRRDRNSPLRTFSVTALTAVSEPNRLVTARSSTSYAWSLYWAFTPHPPPRGIRAPYGQWPPPVHTQVGPPRVSRASDQRLQALRTTTPPATTATTAVPSSTRMSAPKPYRPG